MNLTITQENVHLLLPSKLSWMANMLAEDRGISIVEAMKLLYASDVYSAAAALAAAIALLFRRRSTMALTKPMADSTAIQMKQCT